LGEKLKREEELALEKCVRERNFKAAEYHQEYIKCIEKALLFGTRIEEEVKTKNFNLCAQLNEEFQAYVEMFPMTFEAYLQNKVCPVYFYGLIV
jgi:hypothetical protein